MSKSTISSEKMVYFRTSLSGFNRQDVNSYIEKLNLEFAERERFLKRKIDALEVKASELEAARQSLSEAQFKISELERSALQNENLISAQNNRIDEQSEELSVLRAENERAIAHTTELEGQLAALSDAIEKSEKYDGVSSKIGEIMLTARNAADSIIEKANREAESIKYETGKKMMLASNDFNLRAEKAAEKVGDELKRFANESYASLAAKTEETASILHTLAKNIGSSVEELESNIANVKVETDEAVKTETGKLFTANDKI